tara:strand:+ start:313 stop:1251 length:939 start_codon:yes stop_codon:yes gene_type:complete
MKIYSVGIIGLGKIGYKYDCNVNNDYVFLTHFKSFLRHKRFKVTWVCDKNENLLENVKKVNKGLSIEYFSDYRAIEINTDVVVISTPKKFMEQIIDRFISRRSIKCILIEKPFAISSKILNKYLKNENKIIVNYIRRFLPFYKNIKKEIDSKLDKLSFITVKFSGGMLSNGSHFFNLFNFLFPSHRLYSKSCQNNLNEFKLSDSKNEIKINMLSYKTIDFELFEIDFFFKDLLIRVSDMEKKVSFYETDFDNIFQNSRTIKLKKELTTDIGRYGLHSCEAVIQLIEKKKNLSSINDEYKSIELIDKNCFEIK